MRTPDRPTLADIEKWPASVSVDMGCAAYGFSRSHGFELVRRGEFPARVIKAGGRYIVVTADILRDLRAIRPAVTADAT